MKSFKQLFLLVLLAVFGFGQIWADDPEVTISYSDIPDGYTQTTGTSGSFTKTVATANDLTINYAGINTKSSATAADHSYGYAMFLKNNGFVYSGAAPTGYYPSNVVVTFGSNTGTTGKAGITYGSSELSTRNSSVTGAVSKSGTCSLANAVTTKVYWNFSTTGANVQVANIKVTYSPVPASTSCATPTFSPEAGAVASGTGVTISSTDGATIYYTTDGSTPTTGSLTTQPVVISAATTIKAIAVKDGLDDSDVASASYTIITPDYTTIAAFKAAQPATDKYIQFANNVVVTGVNGRNVYVQDENGDAICLYFASNSSWTKGHKVTGLFQAKYATYGNMPEMSIASGKEGTIAATEAADIPAPAEISSLAEATINANMCKYVKLAGVYFQAQALTNKEVNLQDGSANILKFYDNLSVTSGKVLPLTASACDVIGVLISYKQGSTNINEILPVDAACITAGAATLPTLSTPGSTDEGNPTMVANGEAITVTPAANFTCTLNGNALAAATPVSVTDENDNTVIAVTAARDYYTTANATYYFKANAAGTKYAITVVQPSTGGTLSANFEETEAGNTVTLTATPTNSHYIFNDDWFVRKTEDPSAASETVTNNQFTMPDYGVTVTGSFVEASKVNVQFAKGKDVATGDVPSSLDDKYENDVITLPANPFTLDGWAFRGWKHSLTAAIHQPGSYTITAADAAEDNITFTAEWEELSIWALTYTSNITVGTTDKVIISGTEYEAKKAGTSGAAGSTVVTVPGGTTKLHFHAAGWYNENVTLTVKNGATVLGTFALPKDAGMTGGGPTYTLANNPAETEYFYVTLSDITTITAITFEATAGNRFAIFGVNAEYPPAISLTPDTYNFGEVSEALTANVEVTITPNAMSEGALAASIIGTNANKFSVSDIVENKVTVTFTPGEAGTFSASLRVVSDNAEVTAPLAGTGIAATSPTITPDKSLVEFGPILQDAEAGTRSVAVSIENVDENGVTASISGTVFSIDKTKLYASEDIIITANTDAIGIYSETLTLTATGATTKTVTVTMEVVNKWAYTYTSNLALTVDNEDSKAYAEKVKITVDEELKEFPALRAATGSAAGTCHVIVPAATQTLHFHAAAWNGKTSTLTVKMGETTLLSQPLTADAGINTSSPYTLAGNAYEYYYSIDLSSYNLAEETRITFSVASNKQAVIFGVNQEGGILPELQSIAISGDLTNKEYEAGQALNMTGLTVEATYTLAGVPQTPVDVTNDPNLEWSYDPLVKGQTSVDITATFGGKTDTKTIEGLTVTEATPTITVSPTFWNFNNVDQGADVPGKEITVTLTNVAAATVTLSGTGADGFNVAPSALTASGTITITPVTTTLGSFNATVTISDNANVAADATITLLMKVQEADADDYLGGIYTLVTDASQLVAGKKVIIAQYVDADGAINTMSTQATNNRTAVESTVADATLRPAEHTRVMTLEVPEEGKFALKTNRNTYLYAASSESNYLKEQITLDANGKWTISIADDGKATVTATGAHTHKVMRYNENNNLFSCYTGGQKDIAIYMRTIDYVREGLALGAIGTFCINYNVEAGKIYGGTFYQLAGKTEEGKLAFDEVTSLNAGEPYIYQASASMVGVVYGSTTVNAPVEVNGMYGSFEDFTLDITEANKQNILYIAGNKIWDCSDLVDGDLDVVANRCYIKLDEVPAASPNAAPGRRRITLGRDEATALFDLNTSDAPRKLLINGTIYILRGENVYDATGRLVK